jgi:hypothetical protein
MPEAVLIPAPVWNTTLEDCRTSLASSHTFRSSSSGGSKICGMGVQKGLVKMCPPKGKGRSHRLAQGRGMDWKRQLVLMAVLCPPWCPHPLGSKPRSSLQPIGPSTTCPSPLCLPLNPSLPLLQPHGLHSSSNMPGSILPQGLCTGCAL